VEEGVEGPVRGENPGLEEEELRDSVLLLVLPIISNPATLSISVTLAMLVTVVIQRI